MAKEASSYIPNITDINRQTFISLNADLVRPNTQDAAIAEAHRIFDRRAEILWDSPITIVEAFKTAILLNDHHIIDDVIRFGEIDINTSIDANGNTPLHLAAKHNLEHSVRAILVQNPNLSSNKDRLTPMDIAAFYHSGNALQQMTGYYYGYVNAIPDKARQQLINLTFSAPKEYFKETTATIALYHNQLHEDITIATVSTVIKSGNPIAMKTLLTIKEDLNTMRDKDGNSPLMLACDHGTYDIVRLIAKSQIELHACNHSNQNALDIALERTDSSLERLLLCCGLTPNAHHYDSISQKETLRCQPIISSIFKNHAAIDPHIIQNITAYIEPSSSSTSTKRKETWQGRLTDTEDNVKKTRL